MALLPFTDTPDYSLHKWVLAPCNEAASLWVLQGVQPTPQMACLYGESQAGKTHLANIFVHLWDGFFVETPPVLAAFSFLKKYSEYSSFAFDNITNFPELWLFNIFNLLKEERKNALFLLQCPPLQWNWQLKDWDSRLKSIPIFSMKIPDEESFFLILKKRLRDVGICMKDDLVKEFQYCIPRNFSSLDVWIDRLNQASLTLRTPISKKKIHEIVFSFESEFGETHTPDNDP
jgi:chromosomal replication initiation ATPase DnaA